MKTDPWHSLIVFDVANPKRLRLIAKHLEGVARRVQKSVFESNWLTETRLANLQEELSELMDPEEDDLRYYRLCNACSERIVHEGCGVGLLPEQRPFSILDDGDD